MLSKVLNLDTMITRSYSLNAKEALTAAYEQDKGNFNTWTYKDSKIKITEGRYTLSCGSLSVIKDSKQT